eukprot:527398-Amphidinium_carterae.1
MACTRGGVGVKSIELLMLILCSEEAVPCCSSTTLSNLWGRDCQHIFKNVVDKVAPASGMELILGG